MRIPKVPATGLPARTTSHELLVIEQALEAVARSRRLLGETEAMLGWHGGSAGSSPGAPD